MRIFTTLALPLALLGMLGACTALPRSGPYRSDLMQPNTKGIAVVDINPATTAVLATISSPSLAGAFGDYRPPSVQRIGVGDGVAITIWEAASGGLFSSPVVDRTSPGSRTASIPEQLVGQDGAITVPFAGRVRVAGQTPPEVERTIVDRLQDKAIQPQALVTVTRNISNTVTIMGEVTPGARVPLSLRGDRLLDVLATAGGVRAATQDVAVVLARGGRNLRVPMQAVLDDPKQDIYLQPGDVVTLVRDPQTFSAIGATGRNTEVAFPSVKLTLDEAIAIAGGLVDQQADARAVFVIRYELPEVARRLPQFGALANQSDGVPTIYRLNMYDQEALFMARRFPMRNKDILYVSDAPFTDLQKVLGLINLLTTPVITGIEVNSVVK